MRDAAQNELLLRDELKDADISAAGDPLHIMIAVWAANKEEVAADIAEEGAGDNYEVSLGSGLLRVSLLIHDTVLQNEMIMEGSFSTPY